MTKRNLIIYGIGLAIGAIGGYLYYYFVGCASGTCPITSNPLTMILYGSAVGVVLSSFFTKRKEPEKAKERVNIDKN